MSIASAFLFQFNSSRHHRRGRPADLTQNEITFIIKHSLLRITVGRQEFGNRWSRRICLFVSAPPDTHTHTNYTKLYIYANFPSLAFSLQLKFISLLTLKRHCIAWQSLLTFKSPASLNLASDDCIIITTIITVVLVFTSWLHGASSLQLRPLSAHILVPALLLLLCLHCKQELHVKNVGCACALALFPVDNDSLLT